MFELDLLSERARVTPDRLAVVSVETGERLTYRQLDDRAELAAATLRTLLEPGDRFGILAHNCLELIELFFAAGKSGAIAVPLPTRATAHELRQIALDCGMKVLFHGDEFAAVSAELPVAGHPIAYRAGSPQPIEAARVDPEAIYCLLYTSGTTGKPKGVMIPRRQLYWNGYNTAINWGLRDDDVTSVFTPMYHAGGLAAFFLPLLCTGGAIVIHRTFDAAAVWRTIERERCSVVLGVPTIWKILLDAPEFATVDLSHVRWLISGGAPLPQFIIDAYQKRGVAFKQGYGMTEVGVNCFTMTVEESFAKPGSIGRPMLFTEVKLEEMDGDVGEMFIRGPHVSSGYWSDPEASAASYLPGGWFRTGDLARRDADGFFYIAGRRKEMFISGGVNVYPAEIEAELVAHAGVSDAAVVAVPDEKWGEAGVAFVVTSAGEEELVRWLTDRIARYKIPKRFVFVDELPRTPYGKVMKEELRRRLGYTTRA
jgi:fatty-acyl-CoA synthase